MQIDSPICTICARWGHCIEGFAAGGAHPGDSTIKQSQQTSHATPPPHVNLIYFGEPLSLRVRVIPHTARKVSSICSRHFRHLQSFNSHGGVYKAPTKRRSTAGAESGVAALCTRFLFLTREDVVVRTANTPLARGCTSSRPHVDSVAEVVASAAHSRTVRDA